MAILDYFVDTEADAIHILALVRAGVSVSSRQMGIVTGWCEWELTQLEDAVAALVPGQANPTIQPLLATAQVAMNAAGDKSLNGQARYLAVKHAEVAVAALAVATVGSV